MYMYLLCIDDGSIYKAALLSGPPGVGKTTSAILVCKVRKDIATHCFAFISNFCSCNYYCHAEHHKLLPLNFGDLKFQKFVLVVLLLINILQIFT